MNRTYHDPDDEPYVPPEPWNPLGGPGDKAYPLPHPMHTYLNTLVCVAAPCDGEMQDAIEHAIRTGQFNPTGTLLTDNETIGRDGAAWLQSWREHLDRVAAAQQQSVDFMLTAIAATPKCAA